ncbi:MAG: 50S ribosomal protein L20 [Terriglobia bacterium]
MPRVKRGTVRRAKRKKLARLTKGFFLTKSKLYRSMKEAADRAGRFAYRDRRRRKRDFRRLWITRISAAARINELTYSQFMFGLKKLGILLDRKMLSEMAARDSAGFAELAGKVREAVNSSQSTVESQKPKAQD